MNIDIKFIIAQIFGLVAFIISIFSYHKKTKEKILLNQVISNSLNMVQYLLLNAYTGLLTKVLAIARDEFVINKSKNKKYDRSIFLYMFIVVYIIIAIITYKDVISLLPLIVALIYIIFIWSGNEQKVRKISLLCYILWLIYNICVYSIFGVISNIISMISIIIAIKRDSLSH